VLEEKRAFERMMRQYLRPYFSNHIGDLVKGNINIRDDGSKITIYNARTREYDWCIVY